MLTLTPARISTSAHLNPATPAPMIAICGVLLLIRSTRCMSSLASAPLAIDCWRHSLRSLEFRDMPCRDSLCSNFLLMKNAINDRPMYEKAMLLIDRLYGMVGAYEYINQSKQSNGGILHPRVCVVFATSI